MRVAVYCRVSSQGQELEQQVAACQRFCDYREYDVSEVYSEIISGATKNRGREPQKKATPKLEFCPHCNEHSAYHNSVNNVTECLNPRCSTNIWKFPQ